MKSGLIASDFAQTLIIRNHFVKLTDTAVRRLMTARHGAIAVDIEALNCGLRQSKLICSFLKVHIEWVTALQGPKSDELCA